MIFLVIVRALMYYNVMSESFTQVDSHVKSQSKYIAFLASQYVLSYLNSNIKDQTNVTCKAKHINCRHDNYTCR